MIGEKLEKIKSFDVEIKQMLSDCAYALMEKELKKYPVDQKKSAVIACLVIAQREIGYISSEIETESHKNRIT